MDKGRAASSSSFGMSGVNAHVIVAASPVRDVPSTCASKDQPGSLTQQQTQMRVMPAAHALLRHCSTASGASRGTVWLAADLSCPQLGYLHDHKVCLSSSWKMAPHS